MWLWFPFHNFDKLGPMHMKNSDFLDEPNTIDCQKTVTNFKSNHTNATKKKKTNVRLRQEVEEE